MITLKFFTEKEGARWIPFNGELSKDRFLKNIDNGMKMLFRKKDGSPSDWSGAFFSDGSVFDKERNKFRSEESFPKDEMIDYMNNILIKEQNDEV